MAVVKLKKRHAEIVLACLEELREAQYWRMDTGEGEWARKSREGERAINEIVDFLEMQYGVQSGMRYKDLFEDLRFVNAKSE